MTPTLDQTLLALLGAVDAPGFARESTDGREAWATAPGIVVTGVDLTIPLEATFTEEHGELVVRAGVPHTRWVSGFLPPVHLAHLQIEAVNAVDAVDGSEAVEAVNATEGYDG